MTEKSIFWTTGSTGDGTAEYTMAELVRWLRQTYLSDNTDEGVLKGYGGELAVSGTASPVDIASGGALVYGFPYWSTAASTLAIPTPSGDTRIDRVVLEVNWTAQTVRIARVAGAEGGAAPALTQTDGVTWQVSLAQASITVGGVITVTDERVYIHPNWEVEAGQFNADVVGDGIELSSGAFAVTVDDSTIEISGDALQIKASGLDNSHFADRTGTFVLPASECYNVTDTAYRACDWRGWEMVDNKLCECYGAFLIPPDLSGTTLSVIPVVIPAATGNIYCEIEGNWGAVGEAYTTNTDSDGYSQVSVVADDVEVDSGVALNSITVAAGDYVTLAYRRDAVNVGDTVNNMVYFVGFLVSYTRDM